MLRTKSEEVSQFDCNNFPSSKCDNRCVDIAVPMAATRLVPKVLEYRGARRVDP
jgi:hypothetical protein